MGAIESNIENCTHMTMALERNVQDSLRTDNHIHQAITCPNSRLLKIFDLNELSFI